MVHNEKLLFLHGLNNNDPNLGNQFIGIGLANLGEMQSSKYNEKHGDQKHMSIFFEFE